MKTRMKFMTSILAGSVVSTMSLYPVTGYAADDASADNGDDVEFEEIVVTGIRGSQMRALQAKRNSDSIMDGIAAEDMGKFPDSNISEALQRIPGVTIDRSGGEGQFVTVRGMGPAFNTVLLNGRVLATENEGREFSFDILAAELITAADVFKTPTASLVEGGIGATINMKTARPLDFDGFRGSVTAKGLYDTSRKKTSPQASGFLSQTFNDGKFGVLASFNYVKRDFRTERVFTDGFEANKTLNLADGRQLTGVSVPTFVSQNINQTSRKRIGGTLVLQWQASDDLLLTLDGVYSKLDVDSEDFSTDFSWGTDLITDATVDKNNTVTHFTLRPESRPTEFVVFNRPRRAKTRQAGFNAEWQVDDNLSAVFDTAYSKSTDRVAGKQSFFVLEFPTLPDGRSLTFDNKPGEVPHIGNFGDITDLSKLRSSFFTFEGQDITDETYQATFDLNYDLDNAGALTSVETGVSFAHRQKSRDVTKTPGLIQCLFCSWGGHENNVFIPTSISSFQDVNGFLDGQAGVIDQPFPKVGEADLIAFLNSGESLSVLTAQDSQRRTDEIAALAANGGGFGVVPRPGDSGVVTENNYSAYVQAKFEGSFGDTPWSGNMGLRYTRTDVASAGVGREVLSITAIGGGINDSIITFTDPIDIVENSSYHVWLPSANFKVDMYEDVTFRAAIGKSLTRATLSDLLLRRSISARTFNTGFVKSGNPGLKPMIAWNYDANLTWYIDDASYLSVAWFHKDLSNQSRVETNPIQILGFNFDQERPENTGNGSVDGVELSLQYTFSTLPAPFDGLGVQGNYTNVTQKTDGENEDETSESYNLVGFYEKGPIQARVAYVYRAGYLASRKANRGQPKNIRGFGQWDASASYDITDFITVFVEAINITNSRTKSFSIYENRLIELADTGSRYAFGVRVDF